MVSCTLRSQGLRVLVPCTLWLRPYYTPLCHRVAKTVAEAVEMYEDPGDHDARFLGGLLLHELAKGAHDTFAKHSGQVWFACCTGFGLQGPQLSMARHVGHVSE
jgi:hypothetical protein